MALESYHDVFIQNKSFQEEHKNYPSKSLRIRKLKSGVLQLLDTPKQSARYFLYGKLTFN